MLPDCRQDPRHECFGLEAAAKLEGRVKALFRYCIPGGIGYLLCQAKT